MIIVALSGGVLINWVTLMITDRIFTAFSSETQATWKEDAQASGVIVLLTVIAYAIVTFLHLPTLLVFILYIYLIYHAFQLDGLHDIITFYFLHGFINAAIMYLGVIPIFWQGIS